MNVASQKKSKAGRPNKYYTHVQPHLEEIGWWCRDGLIDVEICKRLGITERSFIRYKKKYCQLSQILKENKQVANYRKIDSLSKRADGYTFTEITQTYIYKEVDGVRKKHLVSSIRKRKDVAPDTAALIVWLKNRAGWHNRDSGSADNDTGKLDELISAITNTKRV